MLHGPGETEGITLDEAVSVAALGRSLIPMELASPLALTIPDGTEVSAGKLQDGEINALG